ncbi:MAG: MGH1-like glycoside hydrolase domain-containing protein [Chloroflexota bacterium]
MTAVTEMGQKGRTAESRLAGAQVRLPGELPAYRLLSEQLETGGSFGNAKCWINTRGSGEIEQIFVCDLGAVTFGAIAIRYAALEGRLVHPRRHIEGERLAPERDSFVQLRPYTSGMVEILPCYQRHEMVLPGGLAVSETVFVPSREVPAAYQIINILNQGAILQRLRVYGFARLRGLTVPDIQAHFDPGLGALVGHNQGHPEWVRCFGCLGAAVLRWETSADFSQVYETTSMHPLDCDTSAAGDILAGLEVEVELDPGEVRRFAFLSAFSHQGEKAARAVFTAGTDFEQSLQATVEATRAALSKSQVMTPDPVLNEGAVWAKVNMQRVMCDFPRGRAFTNDPSQSSAVVARDSFWFVYGCDHMDAEFSRSLLDIFTRRQQSSGKIIEFFHAVTGQEEDYGLNINDNTPLYILAVNHHWRSTGDLDWLKDVYPAVGRAARYILSQRDERGLVLCTATGTGVYGIAGWRNVIDDYTLSGAVTEINAECCAALRAAGHLADNLGNANDAQEFSREAGELREAINRHLLNPNNGLYYLNIDLDGGRHTDVTGDEVFPVIFRVSPEHVGYRIMSRLNSPDFWTDAGLRTASRDSLEYEAFRKSGLVGGVWPGLTWWYAFAAARYHPEFMVKALRSSFEHYNRNPKQNNTVPGQFSEWFDGESLVNRGMRLSPWEAPRFLWAAVEGVCGVMLGPRELKVEPLIPDAWKWVALRNLPFQGAQVSFFGRRHKGGQLHLYSTHQVNSGHTLEVYPDDVSDKVLVPHPHMHHVALRRVDELVVCVGNSSEETSVTLVQLAGVVDSSAEYHLDEYNSELNAWTRGETSSAAGLRELALSVNGQGYRILRLTKR